MTNRVELQPKLTGATQTYQFDFSSLLAQGETISTQVVAASTYSGTDGNPSTLISGSASASGAVVSQKITNGHVGVIYELKCTITTSLSQTLQLVGYLAITPDLV